MSKKNAPKQLTAPEMAVILYQKTQNAQAIGTPLSGTVILCDSSGSMRRSDDTQKTRFEYLIQALDTTKGQLTNAAYFHFNSIDGTNSFTPDNAAAIYPHGGTPMDEAIIEVSKRTPKHLLIIADGEPDNEQQTIEAAKKFPGRIDVIYVGDEKRTTALHFMEQLARTGGGTTVTQTLTGKKLPAFTNQIKNLLPHRDTNRG